MLKVITLFTGIGAQEAALKRLGLDFEMVGISEIDKYAIQSYEAINGPTRNYGDITQIERLDYADLWTYSSPCFTKDSLVLTEKNGYKQITNLQIGESVLTHDGTYKTVEKIIDNGMKKTVKVYGMGVDEIHTTPNHLFYVREKSHVWNCKTRSYMRVFSKPMWKQVDSLKRIDYMGVPINNKSEIPEWNGITFAWSDGRKDRYKNQLSQYMNNKDFWWLIGRYIADGWFRKNGGIIIGCGKNKFIEMKEKCDSIGLNYSVSEERTVIRFRYPLKELELFVQPFGKYAYGKRIPSFVMDLPLDLLKSFLNGYMAGDGYYGIWNPKHCRADNQGYVFEHTLVYEKNTGYLPKKGEVIHHIDIDKFNNEFSNLYLCNHKEHLEIHRSIEKLIKPLLKKKIIGFKKGGYYIINDDEVNNDRP